MTFAVYTHDAWGVVPIGTFHSLEEARQGFRELCQDPWYRQDGGVKGLELVQNGANGERIRLDWFSFR